MVLPFDIFSETSPRGNPKPCATAHGSSPGSEVYRTVTGDDCAAAGVDRGTAMDLGAASIGPGGAGGRSVGRSCNLPGAELRQGRQEPSLYKKDPPSDS